MSNTELRPAEVACHAGARTPAPVQIITSRLVPLGGPRAMTVRRTLPHRDRSMIGAWCFVDHYGPDDVASSGGMDVAPHPHTGLQTVSWLFRGAIDHIDSGGNAARVLPGELNLMTAGAGICHSEVSTGETTILHGAQLWLALPDPARHQAPRRFDHFAPRPVALPGGEALVFLGSLAGATSPVATYSPVVGAEIRLRPGAQVDLALDAAFEHGVLVDEGDVTVDGAPVAPGELGYLGIGAPTVCLSAHGTAPARLLLIGGEPFGEEIIMWWNFVGRDSDEIAAFRAEWQAGGERFGEVVGYVGSEGPGRNAEGLGRLPAPTLPTTRLRPRRNKPPHVPPAA